MADKIQCATHGECFQTFVCTHLLGETAGLGFNRDEPDDANPFPDAWCDNCEIIRAAHDGWNEESEKLSKISLLCSACYERSRIRNTRPSVTLNDLAGLRWKCGSCEEWHTGSCLDFGVDSPYYWSKEKASHRSSLLPNRGKKHKKTFLDADYCAIENKNFFVRGLIHGLSVSRDGRFLKFRRERPTQAGAVALLKQPGDVDTLYDDVNLGTERHTIDAESGVETAALEATTNSEGVRPKAVPRSTPPRPDAPSWRRAKARKVPHL